MSVRCHSRLFWRVRAMSAVPLMATEERTSPDVSNVPTPDMISLLDYLVGAVQHRWRDFEAKRFGGLEIDHQLECGRLLNWYIA